MGFFRAVKNQPRGKSFAPHTADRSILIKSLSNWNVVLCFVIVVIPRFYIAFFLWYLGSLMLVYTYNINDLLMNAVVLGFVMELDEQLYAVFAPSHLKRMLQKVEPLTTPRIQVPPMTHSTVKIIIVIAVLISVHYVYLDPFINDLKLVEHYLCEGSLTLITTTNAASHAVYSYDSGKKVPSAEPTHPELITLQLAGLESASKAYIATDQTTMLKLAGGDVASGASEYHCIDHITSPEYVAQFYGTPDVYYALLEPFHKAVHDASANRCSDIGVSRFDLCVDGGNPTIRAICPHTCGCDNAWAGNGRATAAHGCPSHCSDPYTNSLVPLSSKIPAKFKTFVSQCLDVNTSLLIVDQGWKNFAHSVQSYYDLLSLPARGQQMMHALSSQGCNAVITVVNDHKVNVCQPGRLGRTVRHWCPVACRKINAYVCTAVDMDDCPLTCYR